MRIIFDLVEYTIYRAKKASRRFWQSFQNWRKEKLISEALETDEGRIALAQSMVEPIRRSLEYQAIGRKIFGVEPMPDGALAQYKIERPEFLPNGLQKYPRSVEYGE